MLFYDIIDSMETSATSPSAIIDTPTTCKKVVFVTGAGHSGTTLLGMMLGTGEDILYAGEVFNCQFLNDETRPLKKRSCRACGIQCPIWKGLHTGDNVYETLSKRSGRPTIIDSSKIPIGWVEREAVRLSGILRALVFLVRDPRAVVAANLRKHPDRSVGMLAEEWAHQIRRCEDLVARFPGPVVYARYEELVTKPGQTLRTICDGFGIPFEAAMLEPWDADHHPLRGNAGTQSIASGTGALLGDTKRAYYATHPRAIVFDERWKKELDENMERDIEKGAGELYQKYVWEPA